VSPVVLSRSYLFTAAGMDLTGTSRASPKLKTIAVRAATWVAHAFVRDFVRTYRALE